MPRAANAIGIRCGDVVTTDGSPVRVLDAVQIRAHGAGAGLRALVAPWIGELHPPFGVVYKRVFIAGEADWNWLEQRGLRRLPTSRGDLARARRRACLPAEPRERLPGGRLGTHYVELLRPADLAALFGAQFEVPGHGRYGAPHPHDLSVGSYVAFGTPAPRSADEVDLIDVAASPAPGGMLEDAEVGALRQTAWQLSFRTLEQEEDCESYEFVLLEPADGPCRAHDLACGRLTSAARAAGIPVEEVTDLDAFYREHWFE